MTSSIEEDMGQYCKEIIENYNNIHYENLIIQDYKVKSIKNEVIGYLADYYTLILKCTRNENGNGNGRKIPKCVELNMFVKRLPQLRDSKDERWRIFQKESHLYRHLLPELRAYALKIWLPRVYLCRNDILILEDVRYSDGDISETYCLNRRKANISEMFNILRALASMHCSSLVYEERLQCRLDKMFSNYLHEICIDLNVPWFSCGLKTILDIVQHYYPLYRENRKLLGHLEEQMKLVCVMARASDKYRNVLCHRDTWGGNILLNSKTSKVIFVDFQTCSYCPPAIDLIFTLLLNLSKDDIRQYQKQFLRFYYDELMQCLRHYEVETFRIVPFTEMEFYESYNELLLVGLVYRTLVATIVHVPQTMIDDHYKNVERFTKLQKYMDENIEYREMLLESIQDIIDHVNKNGQFSNC